MPSLLLYLTIEKFTPNLQKRQTYSALSYFLKKFKKKKKKNYQKRLTGPKPSLQKKWARSDCLHSPVLILNFEQSVQIVLLTILLNLNSFFSRYSCIIVKLNPWNMFPNWFGFSVSANGYEESKISNIYWILVNFSATVWVVNAS